MFGDTETLVANALTDSADLFAEELSCSVQDVRILIGFDEEKKPKFFLYQKVEGKWKCIRDVDIDEVI